MYCTKVALHWVKLSLPNKPVQDEYQYKLSLNVELTNAKLITADKGNI